MTTTGLRAARPRISINSMLLAVAACAAISTIYAATRQLHLNRASIQLRLEATALWTLSALLPALWLRAFRRMAPKRVAIRFTLAAGLLGGFLMAPNGWLLSATVVAAVIVPSIGWYALALVGPGPARDRGVRSLRETLWFELQFTLTFLLFFGSVSLIHSMARW